MPPVQVAFGKSLIENGFSFCSLLPEVMQSFPPEDRAGKGLYVTRHGEDPKSIFALSLWIIITLYVFMMVFFFFFFSFRVIHQMVNPRNHLIGLAKILRAKWFEKLDLKQNMEQRRYRSSPWGRWNRVEGSRRKALRFRGVVAWKCGWIVFQVDV